MQTYYNRERKKGKHLTLVERCIIEADLKEKKTHKEISERIGVSTKTIQREVKRGSVELLNSDLTVRKEYVAEFAHQKYRDKQKAKEGILKIGSMQELANDIENLIIKEKYSPFAALEVLKKRYEIPFGWRTLYNYIYKKIFLKLRKKHLPYNKKYERHEEVEKCIKKNGGRSIEEIGIAYFYAHSYCSYERGSNENNNRFIRRFIKKGTDIGQYSKAFIKKIESYMNAYPRKQFGGKSADEVYKELFT